MDCSIIPQVKNKQGELVDSRLFKDLLSLSENREEAKDRYLQTRTNEFKTWFGDWENFPEQSSKVVDENGEPAIVWHSGSVGSDSYDYLAETMTHKQYDDFKNTFNKNLIGTVTDNGDLGPGFYFGVSKEIASSYGSPLAYYLSIKVPATREQAEDAIRESYKNTGFKQVRNYDGVIDPTYEIVVFNPNQIKSFNNNGSFSKTDDNIYYQKQSETDSKNNKELDQKLSVFLKNIGVTINSVKDITDANGNKLDTNAVANLLTKTIDVVDGKAKLDTLPEEASHFLVQILKQNGSPLYNSMKSELADYDIYKQTLQEYGKVYNGNLEKIQDEAMGKIIAAQIVDQFQQENKQSRVASWFNRVMKFIKEKLGLIDRNELDDAIIRNNPFSEAASLIYDKNHTNFKFDSSYEDFDKEEAKYYQLATPRQLEDRIRMKYDVSLGDNGKYIRMDDGKPVEIANRVSDKVKGQDVEPNKSASQKLKEELAKITGTKGHQDLDNIISRVVAERDSKASPARVVKTDEDTYNTLERYVRQMMETIPSDSRIITGTPIYDSKTDTAGTPNMLVVHSDGKVDILQWRFTSLIKGAKVNEVSKALWEKQLQEYKKILSNSYGVTKFGKVRTIPIETKFDANSLIGIRTGSQTFESSPELDPIPISEELTGNEKLDRVIQTLLVRKANIEKSKLPYEASPKERVEFNERNWANIATITKAISDIQLKQDVKEFVNIGLGAIQELADTPINQYSMDRVLDLQKTMSFYGSDMLKLVAEQVKDLPDTDKADLNRLVTQSQLYSSNLEDEIIRRVLEDTGRPDLLEARPSTGVYDRIFRTLDKSDNPVIQSFWKLILGAKSKTRQSVVELNSRIKDTVDGVREALPGIASGKLFDFMLQKGNDGKLQIIPKYDKTFYDTLTNSRDLIKEGRNIDKPLAFVRNHTTFDQEAYDKSFENFKEAVTYQYRNDVDSTEKISDRIKSFRNKYSDNAQGMSNFRNPFVKIKENKNLYSKEYQNIDSNPKLKAFYDLWRTESKNFQDYIGKDLGGRFVWNVHNGLIDSFRENGFGAFTNMSSILDHLEAKAGETLGMIDPETGKPLYQLPTYYTDNFDPENQSKDLGKVLSLVAAMAYNHRYMGNIESTSKALEIALQNQQEIQTDSNGNLIKNKLTGAIAKAVGSANTLEQYKDYVNYYVYGVKNKVKDYVLNKDNLPFYNGDRNFSTLATIDSLKNWFVGKSLSFNPVSVIAHALRGGTNVRIIGAMGRFFNTTEYNKSVARLVARDSKFFSLIGYFDLMHGENYAKKAETLSASKLNQYITYDHMFIGHTRTDYTVRNGILGAMMQSHTYDEESKKIVKITDENQTPLYDLLQIKNDRLDFGNIPQEALDGFRNKTQAVGDRVFGMNTRDAISVAHLNIFTRALLTFRNWIPGMVDVRYRGLTHNEDLGEWELGRYRSFWNQVMTKQTLPSLLNGILNFGTFGYGGTFGDRTINRAKELYAQYMEKNPNSSITEQQYIDLHISNLKAQMTEIYITLAMIGAAMAVKKEDGETPEQGSLRKYFSRQIDRSLADIQFFYNPAEFDKILKSPIPITQAYLEPLHLIKAFWDKGEEGVGMHPKEKEHELRRATFQAVPGLNGFESLLGFMDDNYDKTQMIGTDSGSK